MVKGTSWYLLFMPLWCLVADLGQKKLTEFQEKEALKSPHINRLGKCEPLPQLEMQNANHNMPRGGSYNELSRNQPNLGPKMLPYGTIASGGNKAIGAAILAKKQSKSNFAKKNYEGDDNVDETDVDVPPTWYDFCVAIFFIAFGVMALCCGMVSILMTSN